MEFLLSWLGDFVDLGSDLGSRDARAAGRFGLRRLDDVARRESFHLGEKLTSAGLAVEGIRDLVLDEGGPDFVFEVEVTSNRPDAMCHLGLARELAVALAASLRSPQVPLYGSLSSDGSGGAVLLADAEACPRLVARRIRGVRIGPSPEWLRRRLESIGIRSINNVVDATNYVLWELGQPLHAYDLATVAGGELHVRRARVGERLVTLDDVERELDPEILVIADRQRAIGLAGIMGGAATEVGDRTSEILLESAHFDRRRVRTGARRLGLHTDASHRFERGVDFELCDLASRRCAALVVELAGGEVVEPALDAVARRPRLPAWSLDAAALERFAGCAIADPEIERILGGLGFAPRAAGARRWVGAVPSWREVDFEPRRTGEAAGTAFVQDLYEEVLRHVGLDRIPATLPAIGGVDAGTSPEHDRGARVRAALAGFGFAETIHFAFHDAGWDERLPTLGAAGTPLRLGNPLSERYAILRRSLVPNLVAAAEFNVHRGAGGVRLFELGHLFPGDAAAEIAAAAAVAGGAVGESWDAWPRRDLLALKGDFEELFDRFGVPVPGARPAPLPGIVAGTGGEWLDDEGRAIGWFGEVAGTDLGFPLHAAELRLDRLPAAAHEVAVLAPPRLPGVSADLTLTHRAELPWSELERAILEHPDDLRTGFRPKDRYAGEGVPAGAVATTITFDYHGGERSLTQDEVNLRQRALADELERRYGLRRGGEQP